MTVVYPEGTPTLGTTRLKAGVVIPTSLSAPSLATNINAVSSVDITGHLFVAGWNPTGSQGKGQRAPRLGSTSNRDSLNRAQWTAPTLQYVYDPTADDSAPGNEAKELLAEGTEVVIYERRGLDSDTAFAAAQRIRVHHLRVGAQFPMGDAADENGEFFMQQETEYVSDPVDAVIAA